MKKFVFTGLTALMITGIACSKKESENKKSEHEAPGNLVFVSGGTFTNTTSNLHGKRANISDFYIGKYEVTQKEWTDVMQTNPSQFKGDDLPVEMVSWYDCVEYCNKRSIKEGLEPYYTVDKNKKDSDNKSALDSIKWMITSNATANGYRLPTEAEWEYAASGGQISRNYTYSGSNDLNEVAWYWRNSGDTILTGGWFWTTLEKNHCRTKPVGSKKPNELGLYDMTGNVREWCVDWYEDFQMVSGLVRSQRGCSWMGAEDFCPIAYRGSFEANGKGPDQGFRVCRTKNR
ncbi:MAG TPA: SUMF1/EgtB/PvdO family nonheme iron enzyme [Ohtaekwangia sp.]|nr:SUMF1/EgtB/PvdO family nonheme iron enzyme [Ohtaekwangia sp.]